jgi:hypothetical protein
MSAAGTPIAARFGALVLLATLAAVKGARAQSAEPVALEVEFAQGVSPCFSSDELARMVAERLGQSVSTAPGQAPPLAIHVRVDRAADDGYAVAIESRERDSGASGQRELHVGGDCTTLAQPLSLVIALMVGSAVSEPTPAAAPPAPAAPPPAPAPAPPPPAAPLPAPAPPAPPQLPPQPERPAAAPPPAPQPRPPFALRAAAGADLGMNGDTSALGNLAVEFGLVDPGAHGRAGLAGEIAAELVKSPTIDREGYALSSSATGLQTALCAVIVKGQFAADACAGLWTRALSLEGAGDDEAKLESKLVTLAGWHVRLAIRGQVAEQWSVFGGAQIMTLFGKPDLTLDTRQPEIAEMGTGPFFNADGAAVSPSGQSVETIEVYELPVSAVVLLAGVTFAP